MTLKDSIKFGDTRIDYRVLRSARRKKTIEITLDHQEGVLVAAPIETPPEQIAGVVQKRAAWIICTAHESILCPVPKQLVSGESIPYLGRQVRLFVEPYEGKRAEITFSHWSFKITFPRNLSGEERRSAIARALVRWYKQHAAHRLAERVSRWAPQVGCETGKVLVRNQRQRWGSCSPDGTLRFNWRVIQLEPGLLDYVIVHELVHTAVRRHSVEFWEKVAQVLPDFRLRRERLKEAGASVIL